MIGLAARAVIGFVIGVTEALDCGPADRTWFAKAAMHGHAIPECGDVFRELIPGFGPQLISPVNEGFASGAVETLDFFA